MTPDRLNEMAAIDERKKSENLRAFLKLIRWAEFYPLGNLGSDYQKR